jgi:putative ABC transport system permease protein
VHNVVLHGQGGIGTVGKANVVIIRPKVVFIGVILGTPLGLYLVYIMISTSGDSFDMMVKLTPVSFIICAVITLVVSTLVSLLFTRYIKKLDMVTSLKGVE